MKGIYIVGNYPDKKRFKECFNIVAELGFDFIEVGMPFNDPLADGPVIAKAANDAIDSGVTTEGLIKDLQSLADINIKKYIMTYSNIIYSHGIKPFSDSLKNVLNGMIVADLPNRMAGLFYDNGFELPIVPFATLETRESDIAMMNDSESEIIYFVGVRGITGSQADFSSSELVNKIKMIKEHSNKKVIIGFGIKNHADVQKAMEIADGFVVGTEAVKRQEDPAIFKTYLQELLHG